MSLSKKNLDKLNNFVKNTNLVNERKSLNLNHKNKNHKNHKNPRNDTKFDDPNEIFYTLIDNSETLSETTKINHLLKTTEEDSQKINTLKNHDSNQLSIEDELYDEFNYLLDE